MYLKLSILLSMFPSILCEANLHLIKKVEKNFTPLNQLGSRYYSVEEKVGTHFSLLCELVFSSRAEAGYDKHISWIRKSGNSSASRVVDFDQLSDQNLQDFHDSLTSSELNKAEKKFDPLKLADNGSYICFTIKYKKYITLDLLVRSDERITSNERNHLVRDSMFCTDSMFKCTSNGLCIIPHYVCDGKPDCKDGSDEDVYNCNGDPCKDKLKCEDGRCIPTSWCCDSQHDPNCTVTNRPKCCQILAESYEELEYGVPNFTVHRNNHSTSAKYLFISICILSILFSLVILLLILSKVMIFAKKTALQQQRNNQTDLVYYHRASTSLDGVGDQQPAVMNAAMCRIPYVYGFRNPSRGLQLENGENGAVDPLLSVNGRFLDRPPAYERRFSEPPPPYTSREVLNDAN